MPDTHINRRVPGLLKRFAPGQRVEVVSDSATLRRGTLGTVDYPVGRDHLMLWIRTDRGGVALVLNTDIDEAR